MRHGHGGGRRSHRLCRAADGTAVRARRAVHVQGADFVVVGLAHRRAGVDVAGGGGGAQQAVAGALLGGAVDLVLGRTVHRRPCQLGLAAGGGIADGHAGRGGNGRSIRGKVRV